MKNHDFRPISGFISELEMFEEIFHFEIFKNFMKILKYFKTPFFEIFHETFNFQY